MPATAVVETTFAALDKNVPSVVVGAANSISSSLVKFFPKKSVIKIAGGMFLPKEK